MSTVASGSRRVQGNRTPASYVKFNYGNARYTVNPEKSKVYSNWVEVETSRAADILSAFRNQQKS